MLVRSTFVVALIVASFSLVAAQGSRSPSGQTKRLQPLSLSRRPALAGAIDTRMFFPQVSTSIGQKLIRPQNPTLGLAIKSGSSRFSGEPGMTLTAGPRVEAKFLGVTMTGFVPADPDVAVGTNHIVQVVNTTIAFYTKAGVLQFSQTANDFFVGVRQTTGTFDPKVMYDRIANRWVIVFLEQASAGGGTSNVLFAISDDSDPNGTWHRYAVNTKISIGGFNHWMDYPGFGYNKDGYVVNGNMFRFGAGSFGGIVFFTIPKTPVLTGGAFTPTYFLEPAAGSCQMAETVDPLNAYVFGAARTFTDETRFYGAENVGAAVPAIWFEDVLVTDGPFVAGTAQSTGGAVFDTVGDRIFTAIWRAGHLYLSYNYMTSATITGSRFAQYNTGLWPASGTITEIQAGNYSNATTNQFMSAIDVNKHGDVSILFTRSNTAITSDIGVAGRISSDAVNTMSAPTVLASATGSPYNHSRWGDYFGVDVDPVDDETFWGTGMVVRADGWWDTHIVSWTVSKTWPVVPATYSWARGVYQSGNAASLASDDGNYNVAKAGLVLFPSEPPAQIVVDAVAPTGTVLNFDISAVAKVNTSGLSQKIELWNWVTGAYVQVGSNQVSTMSDSIHSASATGTLADFVQVGTRNVRAKVSFFRTGLTLLYPWTASVDQVQWSIRTR